MRLVGASETVSEISCISNSGARSRRDSWAGVGVARMVEGDDSSTAMASPEPCVGAKVEGYSQIWNPYC